MFYIIISVVVLVDQTRTCFI